MPAANEYEAGDDRNVGHNSQRSGARTHEPAGSSWWRFRRDTQTNIRTSVKTKSQIRALQKQLKASNSKTNSQRMPPMRHSAKDNAGHGHSGTRQLRVALQLTEETIRSKRAEQSNLEGQVKSLRGPAAIEPGSRGALQVTYARLRNRASVLQ